MSERAELGGPVVSLREVCESVRYGYTASASLDKNGPKFLRITDIVSQGINWNSVPYCAGSESALDKYRLQFGDIVVARTGATVGYAKQIRKSENAVFASYLVRFRVNSEIAEPRFVGHLVESDVYRQYVKSQVGGAAQPNANAKVLGRFSFILPPRRVQRRIADILSAYEDLIENNRRRIVLLEQAAREFYREWFVRLRFPGFEAAKIIEGVPVGWVRRHLSELMTTQYGHTASATEVPIGPKFLRGKDINKTSYIDWSAVPYCSHDGLDMRKYALRSGDLVVVRMADPGKVAIVESAVNAVFASYLVRISPRPGVAIPPVYLFHVLSHDRYQGFISRASGGSTRKSASAKLLLDFKILVPPLDVMARFERGVEPLRKQIQTILEQNAVLRQARDLLLPRLMSSQITV